MASGMKNSRIAQLEGELALARERMALIGAASGVVISHEPLRQQLARLGELTRQFLGVDSCVIRRLTGNDLVLAASVGIPPGVNQPERLDAMTGIAGRIISTMGPVAIEDCRRDETTRPLYQAIPGSYQFVSYAGVPMTLDGRLVGIMGVFTHTDLRRFEEADLDHLRTVANHAAAAIESDRMARELRGREARLQAILDAQPDCVIVAGTDGAIEEINGAGCRLVGASGSAAAASRLVFDFVGLDDRERAVAFHAKACRGRQVREEFDMAALDGRRWRGEATAVALSPEGRVLLVIRDVTEQREMELRLRQSAKMDAVGQLAGGIAHDFNNLLTGIIGLAEVNIPGVGGETRDDLNEIRRLGLRGADLTAQLMAFCRRSAPSLAATDLNQVVEDTKRLLSRLIGEHIEVVTVPGADLPPIKADSAQIQQVVLNLAVNARDAMDPGGVLRIETGPCQDPERPVMLTVSDTGHGMTTAVCERIFEPFFTTKEPGKGTGLGLSTVYAIVRQLGGEISVSSIPGKGTAFRVRFPVADREGATEAAAEVAAADGGRGGDETILLAEDDAVLRALLVRVLQSKGYRVLAAADGAAALELSESHEGDIALLVTDTVMPRLGGLELARGMVGPFPRLRILFMSGYTPVDMASARVQGNATMFIQKPFTVPVFLDHVRLMLDAG